jgi:hypothetical protein
MHGLPRFNGRVTPLPDYTVKTYRYLRLGMVVLTVLLGAAIVAERLAAPGCWQTSISGYYYTPARPVLVSCLVAIGLCLVVIKGNTEREDVLLNAAGMLAPVVAFVPTGDFVSCWSVAPPTRDVGADIANNIAALLIAAAAALLFVSAAVLDRVRRGRGERSHVVGLLLSWALTAVVLSWLVLGRGSFEAAAHYAAAVPMFGCIVAVVVLEGWSFRSRLPGSKRSYANRYLVIAASMVASTAGLGLAMLVLDWAHALLWMEAVLIGGFAVFWLLQTHELWDQGVRERRTSSGTA